MLHAEQTTLEWIDRLDYQTKIPRLKSLPKNKGSITKDPENSNLIDTYSNTLPDDFKTNVIENENSENFSNNELMDPKTIYNHAIDGFQMVESRKGFLNASVGLHTQNMGIYCVRWRRSGDISENESKFLLDSIEIVEAPLNIHCYLDEIMYVKVPMTFRISLQNTTKSTLHLRTVLKNADNFMFAGHSQVL